jgi:pyrroline-5-carboxylate reductase
LVILAVKPQDAGGLFAELVQHISSEQVILSVMAGVTIQTIQQELGVSKVVRAMPNLPAEIGRGITAFTATEAVTRSELLLIHNLLNTTGKAIYFEEETKIDAATAVSGSGPAYIYYFMQAMIDAASSLGFTDAEAELLVQETIMGAIHLKNHHQLTCREWIGKVASRGGTTEAALSVFDRQTMRDTIQDAIEAAFNRAVQLGKK